MIIRKLRTYNRMDILMLLSIKLVNNYDDELLTDDCRMIGLYDQVIEHEANESYGITLNDIEIAYVKRQIKIVNN